VPLKAAQEAAAAKKYDEAIAKAKEVIALQGATAYDRYVANQMLRFAYSQQGNIAGAAQAIEAEISSEFTPEQDKGKLMSALFGTYYNAKDYKQAIDVGQRMIKANVATGDTYVLIAQSYYQQNDYKGTASFLGNYISSQEKSGKTPAEGQLQMMYQSYDKLKDNAQATNWLEKMVAYYPKPNYWNNLLYTMRAASGNSDRQMLNIYRLMADTKTMTNAGDYSEMAQIAIEMGTPGEAVSVLEAGIAAKVFDGAAAGSNQRLLDGAKKAADADKAGLAKLETEAKAEKTGNSDLALGRSFLSYGMNDRAEEAIARGLGKGANKDIDEARILLGVAQLRQGKRADAIKTFTGIKSNDAVFDRLAKLWSLHANKA
jgi:hypothetical protein